MRIGSGPTSIRAGALTGRTLVIPEVVRCLIKTLLTLSNVVLAVSRMSRVFGTAAICGHGPKLSSARPHPPRSPR
ncbi:hypothetical protein GCM10009733_006470 [Nonomuraea maheshkhaliensis]|uniref:Uncharacterized protein n=1 Tax=Nonomuraea maheshkhaliensis TaxID=419590 RepID=A0ABP4QM17_9ACTN